MPLYKSGSKLKIKFKLNNKDVSTEKQTPESY